MGGGDNGCDNGLLGVITFNNIPQTEQQSHVIQMLVFVCKTCLLYTSFTCS